MKGDITIRVVERTLGNQAYIRRREGRWHCVLANGVHASYMYGGILCDQMGFEAKLDKVRSKQAALLCVQQHIGRNYTAELV